MFISFNALKTHIIQVLLQIWKKGFRNIKKESIWKAILIIGDLFRWYFTVNLSIFQWLSKKKSKLKNGLRLKKKALINGDYEALPNLAEKNF